MWQTIGQERVVSLLQRALERGALAHAYLMVGPAQVGKMTLALDLARAVNCEGGGLPCGDCVPCQKIGSGGHADVVVVGLAAGAGPAEGKRRTEIGIDQIKEIQHSASLPPFEGKRRVVVIDGAEFLSTEAANCLLKTLEEPAGGGLFLLLTADERRLPVTVVSRCQRLELLPLPAAEMEAVLGQRWGVAPQEARLLARLAHGRLGWAVRAAVDGGRLSERAERLEQLLAVVGGDYEERFSYAGRLAAQFSQNRGVVQGVLDGWLDWWRDLLLVKAGGSDLVTNIDRLAALEAMAAGYTLSQIRAVMRGIQAAGEQLRQNANPRLVLELLMLNIPGKEARCGLKATAL
ncbi:MAG: DNA polymerase III subunit [Chloroflexota bacterium]